MCSYFFRNAESLLYGLLTSPILDVTECKKHMGNLAEILELPILPIKPLLALLDYETDEEGNIIFWQPSVNHHGLNVSTNTYKLLQTENSSNFKHHVQNSDTQFKFALYSFPTNKTQQEVFLSFFIQVK